MQNTLDVLLRTKTIEADIRLETTVDGKQYSATGRYEEQVLTNPVKNTIPPFLRSQYRLEVNFSMNSQQESTSDVNRMTLICHIDKNDKDNCVIEKFTSVEGVKRFSSINIAKLEERLKAANQENVFVQIGEVRNLGGIAAMVRQIKRYYDFSPEVTMENLTGSETIPTVKLSGTLKNAYYKELLEHFGGLDKKGLHPSDFPTDVNIWIGRHNDFPYQVCYFNRQSPQSNVKKPLLQETYQHVLMNGDPIPDLKFERLKVSDEVFTLKDDTDSFLRSLGL
ncbi:hypothetical protein FACS1894170_12160 [Planctomycetales bacterium]|nr:hypothetical protein FACS1894170_12160 [Planctomycetales bacterium]